MNLDKQPIAVALQHLRASDLDDQLHHSVDNLRVFGRQAAAEIRVRLLPLLNEAKRRYDAGQKIGRKKTYHEYLQSLGLNPSTVRSWKRRELFSIFGEVSAHDSPKLDQKEEQYASALEFDIRFDADSAERERKAEEEERKEEQEEEKFQERLKNDPEFRAKYEKEQEEQRARDPWLRRQYILKKPENDRTEDEKQFLRDWERRREENRKEFENNSHFRHFRHMGLLGNSPPPVADVLEFANLGRRAAAQKYHPDRNNGSDARMVAMNRVADWLESATK